MKKLIRFLMIFAVAIVFIAVANGVVKWFLNGAKDVGMARLEKNVQQIQKSVPAKELPKKD